MVCKVCQWAEFPPCAKEIPCCECDDVCNSRQCLKQGPTDWKKYFEKGGN